MIYLLDTSVHMNKKPYVSDCVNVTVTLPFSEHVDTTCKACFLQIYDLHEIRQHFTHEVAILAANTLVNSHLDYFNSSFISLSRFNLHKLQHI